MLSVAIVFNAAKKIKEEYEQMERCPLLDRLQILDACDNVIRGLKRLYPELDKRGDG